MFNFKILFITSFILPLGLVAQRWDQENWGLQLGFVTNFGTHTNNIGLKVQAYGSYEFIQVNSGFTIFHNALNLGGRKGYSTCRINTGVAFMGGKQTATPHITLSGLNTQTTRQYAVAYNYLWYLDNIGTSQRSGGMAAHFNNYSIYIENDFFSGQGHDQFRTSDFAFMYHTEMWEAYIENTLWTGKTLHAERKIHSISGDTTRYKDLSKNVMGKTSHGIVSIGFNHLLNFGNTVGLSIGYDSELVRNLIQNKFMHDKIFVPSNWRKQNAHYPILNEKGLTTFDPKERKKDQLFIQGNLNRSLGY